MADVPQTRRSSLLWLGCLLALAALLSNAIFFISPPGQKALPWVSLFLAIAALILLAIGMKRIFADARRYRAKVLGSVLALVSLGLAGVAIFAFVHSRALPTSTGAPRVGQEVPEFTLLDTNGRSVSLAQLLAPAAGPKPRGVLLVFYRGYW
jgi:4-amino-4-deoxy-L-arabinose transferase-like glycosyltransferase